MRAPKRAGFTLIEVSLALSIFAFSMVSILALFPIGLQSAEEAQEVSRASQIASAVASELRATPYVRASVSTPEGAATLDMSADAVAYLLYDGDGHPIRPATPGDYFSGSQQEATFVARVRSTPLSSSRPRSSSVTIEIEHPSSASSSARSRNRLATIIREQR